VENYYILCEYYQTLKILFIKIQVIKRGYAVYITLYYIFMLYYIVSNIFMFKSSHHQAVK